MVRSSQMARPLLHQPIAEGKFAPPSTMSVEDEVVYTKIRNRWARIADYADKTCGDSHTYDKDGAYLCAGRKDGKSEPCNMFVIPESECVLIKPAKIADPHHYSCSKWEVPNNGDPEAVQPVKAQLDRDSLSCGSTKNDLGFGCQRCEYAVRLRRSDSEGRFDFCAKAGCTVDATGCCKYNEPMKVGKDEI